MLQLVILNNHIGLSGGDRHPWRSLVENKRGHQREGEIVGGVLVQIGGFGGAKLVGHSRAEVNQSPAQQSVEPVANSINPM